MRNFVKVKQEKGSERGHPAVSRVCTNSIVYDKLESIGISILGTRMNKDYKDIKSYKKPNICGNLCPNLLGVKT